MLGWKTGRRNRRTIAGAPTRPAINETVRHAQHVCIKKAAVQDGRGCCAYCDRVAKPVVFFNTGVKCSTAGRRCVKRRVHACATVCVSASKRLARCACSLFTSARMAASGCPATRAAVTASTS